MKEYEKGRVRGGAAKERVNDVHIMHGYHRGTSGAQQGAAQRGQEAKMPPAATYSALRRHEISTRK